MLMTLRNEKMPHPDGLLVKLAEFVDSDTLFVGIGNRLRCDDGVGSYIAEELAQDGLMALDVGAAVENWLGKIARSRPRRILFIDAVHFDGLAGEVRIFQTDELDDSIPSTHGSTNWGFIREYLRQNGSEPETAVLGIQPADCSLGFGMSDSIVSTSRCVAEFLAQCTSRRSANR